VLNFQGTYLNSVITSSAPGYDGFSVATNFKGDAFPDAPRYSFNADGQYSWNLNDAYSAFLGADVRFRSTTQAQLGTYGYVSGAYSSPSTAIPTYALLDLRAGVLSSNGHWRFEAFAHNVTDTYYWTYAARLGDTTVKFTGTPAEYGLTVAYNY
jgi:hypothetical protein